MGGRYSPHYRAAATVQAGEDGGEDGTMVVLRGGWHPREPEGVTDVNCRVGGSGV